MHQADAERRDGCGPSGPSSESGSALVPYAHRVLPLGPPPR
ncbi:hypothetical protein DB32_007646 [Sandaracinus amylolyticus]|uniref:Uncharacterized protein n=1 Tax=Sandaracinus amylolyticus TaxID=927083 RepID=A0A0F6YM96_9BACT|nr:hypothetical protein DB32_007646 [Sandaracinus amylolyticus]